MSLEPLAPRDPLRGQIPIVPALSVAAADDTSASPHRDTTHLDVRPLGYDEHPTHVSVWRRLLALSLFYKVLIANSAIVLLGALGGTAITLHVGETDHRPTLDLALTLGFALVGLALSGVLNALILRAAFSPLARLREVARRVSLGDLSVRAESQPMADVEIAQIAQTFNAVLDEVQHYGEQVRALSGSLLTAQERERQRIARELHDDTGQVLTLLLIRLKLLEERAANTHDAVLVPEIEELRALVTSAVEQVRRLALNLRPPTIDQLGLVPALRSLANTFVASTGIEVSLDLPPERARCLDLGPDRTIAIYRIVQEALTNAAKHANARHISITVADQGADLVATIRDDGQGFHAERFTTARQAPERSTPGVGLFGMEERARLINGTLRVGSAPGRGTVVQLRVPLRWADGGSLGK